MILALVISTFIMIISAARIEAFANKHLSIKILPLSFLLIIGTWLVAEAFHDESPEGYAYFAMAFSFVVELLNRRYEKKQALVQPCDWME